MSEEYIKSGEAAKILHVSEMTLRRWEKSGKLVPHHVDAKNGYKYYTREQLYELNMERHSGTCGRKIEKLPETKIAEPEVAEEEILEANSAVEEFSETSDTVQSADEILVDIEEVEKNAIPAKYHYFSTAKPVRELTKLCLNQVRRVPLGKTGHVDMALFPDIDVKLISGDFRNPTVEQPTPLDLALIEGVVSLKKAGNKVFSVAQLLRHLNGNSRNGCTDEKMAEITQRLRTMMGWRIAIDASAEFKHYKKLPKGTPTYMEGHLLDIVFLKTTTNERGVYNEVFGFPVNGCFEILKGKVAITHETYSEPVGKLTCYQTDLLNIKGVRKTHQNNLIANYLLQKIQGIKNNRRGINSILFKTLREDCYLEECSKQQMYIIRETIVKMLEYWKSQAHIKDYKLIKEKGGAYHSIEIEVDEVKKKNARTGTGRGNKVHTRKSASVPDTNR